MLEDETYVSSRKNTDGTRLEKEFEPGLKKTEETEKNTIEIVFLLLCIDFSCLYKNNWRKKKKKKWLRYSTCSLVGFSQDLSVMV